MKRSFNDGEMTFISKSCLPILQRALALHQELIVGHKGFEDMKITEENVMAKFELSKEGGLSIPKDLSGAISNFCDFERRKRRKISENTFCEKELLSLRANVESIKHVVLVDLDNWSGFFEKLPSTLSKDVVVFCFWGERTRLRLSTEDPVLKDLIQNKRVEFVKCGDKKDAADVGLNFKVGFLESYLDVNIPFTVISGDRGFEELKKHVNPNRRFTQIRFVFSSITDLLSPHFRSCEDIFRDIQLITDSVI